MVETSKLYEAIYSATNEQFRGGLKGIVLHENFLREEITDKNMY